MFIARGLFMAVGFLLPAFLWCTAHAQTVTAYEGARLIIGDGRVLENATLVVRGNRIESAGAQADLRIPAGASRVNAAGKTIMPAIIDAHTHLSNLPDALRLDLRQRAWWGVGAALSMGTDPYSNLELRGRTAPGSARFFSAGRGITAPEPGRITLAHQITSADQGRRIVSELAAQHVDIVKIWVDSRDGKYTKLSPEIFTAIIDEAHRRKLRVTAHLFEQEDAKALLRAGVDSLAHGIRDRDIDDEMVALFRERPNLVLIPNLPDRGVRTDLTWLRGGLADAELAKLESANTDRPGAQAFFGIQSRNLGRLAAAGVRIVLGTDGNRAWGPHEEMQDMVHSGMTPMQVIVAATRNGAAFLGLADTGTLEAGKSAEFIVLDANPLDDIANTRRISAVVLRGEAVDRSQPPR